MGILGLSFRFVGTETGFPARLRATRRGFYRGHFLVVWTGTRGVFFWGARGARGGACILGAGVLMLRLCLLIQSGAV